MKSVKALGTVCLVGFAAVNSQSAVAADSGWYGGLNIGQSTAKIADDRITSQLAGSGLTVTSIDDNKTDLGYKIFGGFKINRNFAIEGGYFNLGKLGFKADTVTAGGVPGGTLNGDIKLQGLNLDAVGILPFTQKFSAFGRIGVQYAEAKDTFTGTGVAEGVATANPNPSKRAANYKVGLGLQYDFTESVGMRGEWERYRIDDAVGNQGDVDLYSLGVVVMFGGAKPAPAPQAAAAPVAAAAPLLVVVPATQQYCSVLDIQFEINQNTVQRESEEKIDRLVIFMKKYPDTTAVIEGHTDEVGTAADNMKLSQNRAQNVVNYLVNHGIARTRLQAVGYGETRPIADNQTEVGKRLNRRIDAVVACATDIEGLTPAAARVTMALEMEFDPNQAGVKPQYREELRKVANFMKANPRVTATVEGHTSNQRGLGPNQLMQLSVRRAQNVVDYLADNFGISRSRLGVQGFGQTRRFAYNTSAEGRQENRRVNIIFDFPK